MRRASGTVITFILLVGSLCLLWLTGVSNPRHLAANLLGSYFIAWGLLLLLLKGSRAEMGTRFAICTLALGFAVACLEATGLISGIDYRTVLGLPIERAKWQNRHTTFDPELGWAYQPYAQLAGTAPGNLARLLCLDGPAYPYDVRLDSHGFRNDVDLRTADVAVLGDSMILASETPGDRTMTTVLGHLSESTVANLGRDGYGPQQQLIVLERYALPLRPAAVVWMFYEGNDLSDLSTYDAMLSALQQGEVGVRPSAYDRSFIRAALRLLVQLGTGCTPHTGHISSGLFRTADGSSVPMYFAESDAWSPKHAEAMARMRAIFQHANELTRSRGTVLAVGFIPMKYRVYRDLVQCSNDANCAEDALNDLPRRLEKVVAQVSPEIRYVDLTPVFVAEAEKGRLLYLPDDTHWSVEGHRLAAEAIAKAIAPLLPRRP